MDEEIHPEPYPEHDAHWKSDVYRARRALADALEDTKDDVAIEALNRELSMRVTEWAEYNYERRYQSGSGGNTDE